MSEIVDIDLSKKMSNSGVARYPWQQWLDGKCRRLVKGADFHVTIGNFRNQVYVAARRAGMTARVCIEDENMLLVQAFPKQANP